MDNSLMREKIQILRVQKKLSQAEVARCLDITRQAYNNYEAGKREPDYTTLVKIADFFHITTDYLLGRIDADTASEIAPASKISHVTICNRYRGKRLDTGDWVYGAYIFVCSVKKAYIQTFREDGEMAELLETDPHTTCQFTQGTDKQGLPIYEDDLITGPSGQVMLIRFGEYEAYCPADEVFMRSVGFYAEAPGYPDMPIGPTDQYATLVGNLHDNPEIWAGCQENY